MSVTSSEHARATQAAADASPTAEGLASESPSSGGHAGSRVLRPFLVLLATLAAVGHGFAVPLTNTDTYFHLRFGHEFLHGAWSPWHPGSVSTFATAHWVPTQWLSEVTMAAVEDHFGLAGVAWLAGAQVVLLVATLYLTARRWAEPLIAASLLPIALVGLSMSLSARPQVLSYVLVVVTSAAWLRTADDGRARWWLVPLTWLWAMLHGMWPVGIALGFLAVATVQLERRYPLRRFIVLALVPLGSMVAAAATPVGPQLYVQLVRVQARSSFFDEWHHPAYTNHAALGAALLVGVALVTSLRYRRQSGWLRVALLLVGVGCALWSWRTVPVAVCVAVPAVALPLQLALGRPSMPRARWEGACVVTACVLTLGALAIAVPHTSTRPPSEAGWVQPSLSRLPSGTPLLTDWEYGGVLMWQHPELDPVTHGYGDTFTLPELRRNKDLVTVSGPWLRELRSAGVRIALVPPTSDLAAALAEHGWISIHRSSTLEMLRAPATWSTAPTPSP